MVERPEGEGREGRAGKVKEAEGERAWIVHSRGMLQTLDTHRN